MGEILDLIWYLICYESFLASACSWIHSYPPPYLLCQPCRVHHKKHIILWDINTLTFDAGTYAACPGGSQQHLAALARARTRTHTHTHTCTHIYHTHTHIYIRTHLFALQGFLPEDWDDFIQYSLYPNYTPTVLLFLGLSSMYGLWKVSGAIEEEKVYWLSMSYSAMWWSRKGEKCLPTKMRKGTQKAMLIRSRSARQASGIGFEL